MGMQGGIKKASEEKENTMFGILAYSLRVASRTENPWDAPDHWVDHDHRTRMQRHRDAQEQRRWLRQTGIM